MLLIKKLIALNRGLIILLLILLLIQVFGEDYLSNSIKHYFSILQGIIVVVVIFVYFLIQKQKK